MEQEKKLSVVIVGGSLSGLMCGIALKHAGHSVTIIDKEGDVRQSHMAGVCLGLDAERFLEHHDRIDSVFTHRCRRAQALKIDNSIRVFVNADREITSWDTYYFRLRANFDGYKSSFYPSPPLSSATDGPVIYDGLKEVMGLRRDREEDKMVLTIRNRTTQDVSETAADLVIGADGPDSYIRSLYLPDCKRQYVGYIAWRGTVPEKELSESTRAIFTRSVTLHLMKNQHIVLYMIPGVDGSLEPGERHLNFLLYTNESPESLNKIMTDSVDGHRHHNIVPAGRLREDVWAARLDAARKQPFPEPIIEIIEKIQRPFVQLITEYIAPKAAFEDGKVLLMGDAVSLFRPHTAFSGTQAGFHTTSIENLVAGKISLEAWEERVLRFSRLHFTQSLCFGKFYQTNIFSTLISAFSYGWLCAVDAAKAWWNGEERLLRGWSSKMAKYDDEK